MAEAISRAQVLAYRATAHGLHRSATDPAELRVLELGVQDNRGTVAQAVSVRLAEPVDLAEHYGPLALAWTYRGAPHLHRTADLPALATALWPATDADALARLGAQRPVLKAAGIPGLAAFSAGAHAMRDAVRGPTPRAEVSTAMTAALPEAYSYRCTVCAVTHVYGGMFQSVGLLSGTRLVPGTTPSVLTPLENRGPVPERQAGGAACVRAYLALHGPATLAEVAGYLGTTQAPLRPLWPDDAVEVTMDGRRCQALPETLDELRAAPPPPELRLLPVLDPWLQARDRELIVPDTATRSALWKVIGGPGAVLARGEVVGVWRARQGKRGTLAVTVTNTTGSPLPGAAVHAEAERYGVVRGAREVTVDYS